MLLEGMATDESVWARWAEWLEVGYYPFRQTMNYIIHQTLKFINIFVTRLLRDYIQTGCVTTTSLTSESCPA